MRELAFTLLAFAAAAVPAPVVLVVSLSAVDAGVVGDPIGLVGLFAGFYAYTLFVAVFFGGIVFVVFRSFNFVRSWVAIGAGGLIGAAFANIAPVDLANDDDLRRVLMFAASGAVSGFLFWVVWRKGIGRGRAVPPKEAGDVPSA